MEKYLQIGKVVNTHGFRGDIKLQYWCDSPKNVTALKKIYRKKNGNFTEVQVEKASVHKDAVLLKLQGIDDFDSANLMREEILYADREDFKLNKETYFIVDLIGLPVIDVDNGKVYGNLKEVLKYGQHDIYSVDTESGEKLLPAVKEFVKKIDLEQGIFVKPIEGIFDEI